MWNFKTLKPGSTRQVSSRKQVSARPTLQVPVAKVSIVTLATAKTQIRDCAYVNLVTSAPWKLYRRTDFLLFLDLFPDETNRVVLYELVEVWEKRISLFRSEGNSPFWKTSFTSICQCWQ